ncbi:MAG: AzlD domain-containing protein [Xanthobacteraceae bacterium]
MSFDVGSLGPYFALLLVGFLPNEIWRLLGIVASRQLDEGSELLVWVRAVATAVLAGVISQLILTPPGPLANLPLIARLGAVAIGFVAFLLIRRSIFVGVLAGELTLIAGALVF